MNEERALRVDDQTTTTGVNYEGAIMSALIAQELAGGHSSPSRTRS